MREIQFSFGSAAYCRSSYNRFDPVLNGNIAFYLARQVALQYSAAMRAKAKQDLVYGLKKNSHALLSKELHLGKFEKVILS